MDLSVQAHGAVAYQLRPIYSAAARPSTLPPTESPDWSPVQPQNRSRRVHTKSRAGCYNCKRRRIKCPENTPTCSHCAQRDLKCQWPEVAVETISQRQETPSSISLPVQVSPVPTFTMEDFRLFYHFLQEAHPHHPVGNEAVWTREIPSIAHSHASLMHSMLGLAASDLYESGHRTLELKISAIEHRQMALKYLKEALGKGLHTFEEANAVLAACFNLLFQAWHLDDGLTEFMSLIRGTVLISIHMGWNQIEFLFKHIIPEEELEVVRPYLEKTPTIDSELACAAIVSLQALEPLCKQEYEKSFLDALLQTATALLTSPCDSYAGIQRIYAEFSFKMGQKEFDDFVNPENDVGQLLQSHFTALQTIMGTVSLTEMLGRTMKCAPGGPVRWFRRLHQNIKPTMKRYFEWPISREDVVKEELARWYRGGCTRVTSASGTEPCA